MILTYRIEYGPPVRRKEAQPKNALRLRGMIAAFLMAFLLLTRLLWPAGTDKLRQMLLPGGNNTQEAIQEMMEQLREGERVGDAVTAFCRQILEDGQES